MPGPRYEDWTHVRIEGSRDAAAPYLPYARKLLGYLAEQRALSGIKTCAIERTLSAGCVVRARFDGDIPCIEIVVSGTSQQLSPALLDGFVVSPGGTQAETFNEVLLQPEGTDNWRISFFSVDEKPVGYPASFGIYSKAGTRPLLDAPYGLKNAGNVDWRNTAETLLVSWNGPISRYFSDAGARGTKLYYKGAVLADVADYIYELIPATTLVEVSGACLVKKGGLLLIVALRRTGSGGFYDQYDTFISIPLRVADGYSPPASGLIEQAARLQPDIVDVAVDVKVLLDRAAPAMAETDEQHPWLFNQSGTQARCMRPEYYDLVHECVVDLASDLQSATFRRESTPWPKRTTTVAVERVLSPVFLTGTSDVASSSFSGIANEPVAWVHFRQFGTSGIFENEVDWVTRSTTTTTKASERLKVAVDFVDDVPVYAYFSDENSVETYHHSTVPESHYQATITDIQTDQLIRIYAGDHTVYDENYLTGFTTALDYLERCACTIESSTTGSICSLETDWLTLERRYGAGLEQSARTVAKSLQVERNLLCEQHLVLNTDTTDIANQFNYNQSNIGIGWHIYAHQARTDRGGTEVLHYVIDDSEAVITSGFDALCLLDLRYQCAAYTTKYSAAHNAEAGQTKVTYDHPGTTLATVYDWFDYGGSVQYWVDPPDGSTKNLGMVEGGFTELETELETEPHVSEFIDDVTATGSQAAETRLVLQVGDSLVLDEVVESSNSTGTPVETNFNAYLRYGDVLIRFTNGTAVREGRTVEEKMALAPYQEVTDTEGSYEAQTGADWLYGESIGGNAAIYRRKYCYSLDYENADGAHTYLAGLGVAASGAPSAFSLQTLTGATPDPAVFHPVSILTPTAAAG